MYLFHKVSCHRAPSRSRKPLPLAYDSLRLAGRGFYGGGLSYGGLANNLHHSHMLAMPMTLRICNI